MNQFTKKTNPSEAETATGRTQTPWVAGLIFKMAMIMSIIFAAFYARVHLNDKTEQLAREKARISEQIREKRTEIQTLNIQLANLRSWENINANIKKYNLALRAANPSQIHQVRRSGVDAPVPSLYGSDTRIADNTSGSTQNASEEIR